jgi:hypothetical protein
MDPTRNNISSHIDSLQIFRIKAAFLEIGLKSGVVLMGIIVRLNGFELQ